VVGVERDQHRAALGRERLQRPRAGDHFADGARQVLRAAGRHLHDPIRPGVGKSP
jgi:hypothetical protein